MHQCDSNWVHFDSELIPYPTVLFLLGNFNQIDRSSPPEVFLEKDVLKICSKFTGKNSCPIAISIKLLYKFIEIALWHECSPVNLLRVLRTPFHKNTYGGLLLYRPCNHVSWDLLDNYPNSVNVKYMEI